MDFEADGSGASSLLAVNAFRAFFGYNCDPLRNRADYTDPEWYAMIQSDIASNLPVYYSMSAPGTGHALVCDGCRNGTEIHMNFGWSGSYDAWYDMNNIGGGYAWFAHDAIFRIDHAGAWPTCELSVKSGNPLYGVSVAVSPADAAGNSNGVTAFTRTYATGSAVALTAPPTALGSPFSNWEVDGLSRGTGRTVSVAMDVSHAARAVYTVLGAPTNDNFANATTLTSYEGATYGSSALSGTQSGEPAHAGQGPYRSVWWKFAAPSNGYFRVDTHGTPFDTVMGVYTGAAVNALTAIASCDDDAYWPDSSVSIYAKGGVTYAIAVAGCYANEAGDVALHWSYVPAAGATHYVSRSGKHIAPFLSWREAATNLAAAVAGSEDGQMVLVTNGLYALNATVTITNGVTVRSVDTNNPSATVIDGGLDARCFYLRHSNAVVNGFAITRGSADKGAGAYIATNGLVQNCLVYSNSATMDGGGIYCDHGGRVRDCTIRDNTAGWSAGGIFCDNGGSLDRCVIRGNTASSYYGGGVYAWAALSVRNCLISDNVVGTRDGGGVACYGGTPLLNCTIASNTAAGTAGGVACDVASSVKNCIVYFNRAGTDSNYTASASGQLSFCCSVPLPGGGNSFTNNPRFVDPATGDYHLAANSPCIDKGTNQTGLSAMTDLDGKPRILNAFVDMGACEVIPVGLDSDGDQIPDWWEWQYSHSLSNLAAGADADGDGFSNLSEYRAGTDPTDSASYLGIAAASGVSIPSVTGVVVRWTSSTGVFYRLSRGTNLLNPSPFGYSVRTNIPATPPVNTETDRTAVGRGPYYYRIRVE